MEYISVNVLGEKIHSIDLLLFPPLGVYILIAVGAVMMFVGFLGCYGAIQESQCLLGTVSHTLSSRFICHNPSVFSLRETRISYMQL